MTNPKYKAFAALDEYGIDRAILSLTSPGAQE